MPDYKQGKIYKIVCNVTGKVYIGSTIQSLSMRLMGHRVAYKRFKESKSAYVTAYQIIEQENYDIVLIENCSCESNEELHKRERYFIESVDCINKNIPSRTFKEYCLDNKDAIKEKAKQYWQDNKDVIRERRKQYQQQYHLDNKDILIERAKQHHQDNKDMRNEKAKQYYQDNKDAMNEKRRKYRLKLKTETSP